MVRTGRESAELGSWVEIDEERLAGNFRLLRRATEAAAGARRGAAAPELLAVVKAGGYGHGAAICARVLAGEGAGWLGVADAAEGASVRAALLQAGLAREAQPRVLVLCGILPEDAGEIVREGLTATVWTADHVASLAAAVGDLEAIPVHLEVDTGMCRQGAAAGADLAAVLHALGDEPRLRLEGVMTHIASSEVAGSEQTRRQHEAFEAALEQVSAAGLRPEWVHVGSTSTVDNEDALNTMNAMNTMNTGGTLDRGGAEGSVAWLLRVAAGMGARSMVRTGVGLYGYCLPIAGNGLARVRSSLRPVMTWKTRVIGLRDVEAGHEVGYNGTFVAERKMRLALLAVGYADGLRRELSSTNSRAGGWVMLQGQRAPIIGRVSMNLTVVDVTGFGEVRVGDEVVVLGEGITADDHARLSETIAYEILCGVKAAGHLRGQVDGR